MFEMIAVIFRSFWRRPATRNYPRRKRPAYADARGHIENDIDACIFCGVCARRCPTKALEVVRAERRWIIDPFKCIICGACVPACPKHCLSMSTAYTPPTVSMYRATREGSPAPTQRAE